jgi:copper oxidase (laccase) domain-containing protein
VHGTKVVRARGPGRLGEADAAFTTEPGLPIAVGTADCYPVIVEGDGGVGIAHAGWRGVDGGVVGALLAAMRGRARHGALRSGRDRHAASGWGLRWQRIHGVCDTTWGTPSIDLVAAVAAALEGLEVWVAGSCTMSDDGYHSYRRDGTRRRQVGVAWLPG